MNFNRAPDPGTKPISVWAVCLFALVLLFPVAGCSSPAPMLAASEDCPTEINLPFAVAPADCPVDVAAVNDPHAIRQSLDSLSVHGLNPANYASGEAASSWRLAATHLRFGSLDPKTLALRLQPDPSLADLPGSLPPRSSAADYRAALEAMAPATPLYATLKAELARQEKALPSISEADALVAAQGRIDSLRASLERLRWLPREMPDRQIIANIPTFEVVAFAGTAEASRHGAIFGEMGRQTPEFSDFIEYIVFNPWWDVPDSIARKDKLSQFQRDPGSISRLGYRILDRFGNILKASAIDWNAVSSASFPYHIRQAPGPANALGQVKFIFPNPHNVYMHDTPERGLFSKDIRTYSSGCIRIQNSVELAGWVLEDTPGWDTPQIDAALASGAETRATLQALMPIHILYLTAFPAADGTVAFAPDIYRRNVALLAALGTPIAKPSGGAATNAVLAALPPVSCSDASDF